MAGGHFLLVEANDRKLAVPVTRVDGILPPARVTPVPFVPDWVDGLVAARGAVMPQIDLAARLWGEAGSSSTPQLLQIEAPTGRFLARVDRVLHLAEGEVAAADEADPLLAGFLSSKDGRIPVVDADRLGLDEWEDGPGPLATDDFAVPRPEEGEAKVQPEVTVLVEAAGGCYAFPVQRVLEVFDPKDVDPLPMAPAPLLGLMPLREQLIPIVSMAALLGRGGADADGGSSPSGKVVLVSLDRRQIGLLVDRIVGLEPAGDIEENEALEGRRGVVACWIARGRPVGLVHLEFLLDEAFIEAAAAFLPRSAAAEAERAPEPRRALLTFSVADHLCALDIGSVERVVQWREPGAVPAGAEGIDGVVQVLGEILPVVDVGRRLGLAGQPRAYLVARLGGDVAALSIGQPGRIAAVPLSTIHALEAGKARLVEAIARIDGMLAWVLSPSALRVGASA